MVKKPLLDPSKQIIFHSGKKSFFTRNPTEAVAKKKKCFITLKPGRYGHRSATVRARTKRGLPGADRNREIHHRTSRRPEAAAKDNRQDRFRERVHRLGEVRHRAGARVLQKWRHFTLYDKESSGRCLDFWRYDHAFESKYIFITGF